MSSNLTRQELACFEPIDRQVPGSNLVGIAQSVAHRVEGETKMKIRRRLDFEVGAVLWDLYQEYRNLNDHDEQHLGRFHEDCMGCRIDRAIEVLGEVTVP